MPEFLPKPEKFHKRDRKCLISPQFLIRSKKKKNDSAVVDALTIRECSIIIWCLIAVGVFIPSPQEWQGYGEFPGFKCRTWESQLQICWGHSYIAQELTTYHNYQYIPTNKQIHSKKCSIYETVCLHTDIHTTVQIIIKKKKVPVILT